MPVSRSGTYIYMDYGTKARFKVLDIGIEKSEKGVINRQLAIPHYVHISKIPFRGFDRKTVACGGEGRCELCLGKHKPTAFYRIKVELYGDEWGDHSGTVKNLDLQKSGHDALAGMIQELIMGGKNKERILQTVFEMERLPSGQRPFYLCNVAEEPAIIAETEDDLDITKEDIELLAKLNAAMKKKDYKNPAQSVKDTLRIVYGWSEAKITVAFNTVLDEDGFLREKNDEDY